VPSTLKIFCDKQSSSMILKASGYSQPHGTQMLILSSYSHCAGASASCFQAIPYWHGNTQFPFPPDKMQLLYKHMAFAITTTLLVTHSLLHFPSIHTRTFPSSRGRNTMLHKKFLHSVEQRPYNPDLAYITLHTKNHQFMYTIQASDHSSAHSSLT